MHLLDDFGNPIPRKGRSTYLNPQNLGKFGEIQDPQFLPQIK